MRPLRLAALMFLPTASAWSACPKGARTQTISTTRFSATACIIDLDDSESIVTIFVEKSGGTKQRFLVPEIVNVYSEPLQIEDFNFDGYPDIVLEYDCPASRPCYHRTYLYNPTTHLFRYYEEFSSPNLTNCSPMAEEKIIRCDFKCSAEDFIIVEYKVIKGHPVKTYESKKNCGP